MQLKLFLNEPPGNRCTNILSSVINLMNKYDLEFTILKKSDIKNNMCLGCGHAEPEFPAVSIDGHVVFEGRNVTSEELENEILKRIKGQKI
ncbi:MAG: hypothetical protein H7844_00230 [Nitrospirae bacterium YQR-1]